MPTYLYHCPECNDTMDAFFKLTEERPETVECIFCGKAAQYQIAAPMVLKASYLDGQRKKKFQDVREASKLNRMAAGEDDLQKKSELKKEARKIGYTFEKE